jgi:hypothetical protein
MAGKIIADQIEHSTAGSLDTSYVVNGSNKVWARWNLSGTAALNDSFSTSSLTDLATGKARITYSVAITDANYGVTGICGELAGGGNRVMGVSGTSGYNTTSSAYRSNNTSFSASDETYNSIALNGDLA